MLDHNIMIRPCDTFGLPDHVRVTIGAKVASQVFIKALKAIL
jgi:histidinol-phosphate/aromatic aminotransferase/cobyric acid decarboxylase-like protein